MTAFDVVRLVAIALPLAVYAGVALTRRPRFRALAARLGATHVDNGMWKPGRILGDGFAVEAKPGWSGRGTSSYHTTVRVLAPGTPGRFFIRPEFFKTFPNWTFVKVSEPRPERVFVITITVKRFVELSSEQRARFLQWIGPAVRDPGRIYSDLTNARVRDVIVGDGAVSTSVSGCVSNFERIKRIVGVLGQLSH